MKRKNAEQNTHVAVEHDQVFALKLLTKWGWKLRCLHGRSVGQNLRPREGV